MKTCDLHSHSNFSDGSLSPSELVALAKQQGLRALALTDHNTTKGLAEFTAAADEAGLQAVPGCEFSTQHHEQELHILGLFMPAQSYVEIEDYVELMHIAKHRSNEKLLARLNEGGYALNYDEIAALTDADEFNRAHVARMLVMKGYATDTDDAFARFLRQSCGYYTPAKKLGSLATIRFIKANGGVAVWAHPFFNVDEAWARTFLPEAVEAGLDGMEVLYSTYTPEQTASAKALADHFGILYSGGSDFHGAAKPKISLGTGLGNLEIPYSYYKKLKEKRQ